MAHGFGHPLLLLTLLVIPLVVGIYLLMQRRRAKYAVTFTNIDVLAGVVGHCASMAALVAAAVFLLALAALCVGMARPQVTKLVPSQQATVILVVDISGSMQAKDVKPTRLGAAQHAVKLFLDHAPKKLRVALIAFAGEVVVAAPPTTDHDLVRQADESLGQLLDFRGTAIGDALAAAVKLGQQAVGPTKSPGSGTTIAFHPHGPQSPVSILLLSDGHQTRGTYQPLEGAAMAKAAGIPVYTVALGTPNGVLDFNNFGGGQFGPPGNNGFGGFGGSIPGASRPGHAARDRVDDRRQVRRGAEREDAQLLVREPRLETRPQAGKERDHERARAARGDPARRRAGPLRALVAPHALTPPRAAASRCDGLETRTSRA